MDIEMTGPGREQSRARYPDNSRSVGRFRGAPGRPNKLLYACWIPELRCRLEDLGLFRARPVRGKCRRGLRSSRQILRCGGTGVLSRLPR